MFDLLVQLLARPTGTSEDLKLYPLTFFFIYFLFHQSAVLRKWMPIKCISEVRS